eukprot:gene2379-5326_t
MASIAKSAESAKVPTARPRLRVDEHHNTPKVVVNAGGGGTATWQHV